MKRTIISMITVLFASVALCAAQGGTTSRREMPTTKEAIDSAVVVRVGRLKEKLALSDEQSLSLIKIYRESYTERAKNAGKDFRSMSDQQRQAMRAANQKTEQAVQDVLTDDQKKLYEQMRNAQRSRGTQRGGRN